MTLYNNVETPDYVEDYKISLMSNLIQPIIYLID